MEAGDGSEARFLRRSVWADRYQMPIRMLRVAYGEACACPARTPEFGRAEWGDVQVAVRIRWIKPWEIDAKAVLELNSPSLDPWAVLFRLSDVQMETVASRLKGRPRDAGLFRILGGMRYRKNTGEWKKLLGRVNPMISREMMRESLAVQEWLDEGRQEGRQEGRARGPTGAGRSWPTRGAGTRLKSRRPAQPCARSLKRDFHEP